MKKFRLIFTAVFIAVSVMSCNDINWNDVEDLNIDATRIGKLAKVYPGGNVACSQLGNEMFVESTGRNNFNAGSFEFAWPEGLVVKVSNDSISFAINGPINGKCYKVGAVIVKGSDASNVYDYTEIYPDGVTGDKGLVAPITSSGKPAGLSNLTFCFVECNERAPVVIAMKGFYWDADRYSAQASEGQYIFTSVEAGPEGCSKLGINYYPTVTTFNMLDYYYREIVGTVTVVDDSNSLKVTVTMRETAQLDQTWLYVGTMEGLLSSVVGGCPDYDHSPLWRFDDTNGSTITFTVPY